MGQRIKLTPLQANNPTLQVQAAGQQYHQLSLTPVSWPEPHSGAAISVSTALFTDMGTKRAVQLHRTFTFISSRLAGRGPGLPTAALLFCRISPLEPEDTEDGLLTVAERLRTAGALVPLCCSPGGLQGKKKPQASKPRWKGTGGPQCQQSYMFRNIWVTNATLDIKAHQCLWLYPCPLSCQPTHFSCFCLIHLTLVLFAAYCNLTGLRTLQPTAPPHTQNTMILVTAQGKQVLSKSELAVRTHTLVGLAGWSDSCSAAAAAGWGSEAEERAAAAAVFWHRMNPWEELPCPAFGPGEYTDDI